MAIAHHLQCNGVVAGPCAAAILLQRAGHSNLDIVAPWKFMTAY